MSNKLLMGGVAVLLFALYAIFFVKDDAKTENAVSTTQKETSHLEIEENSNKISNQVPVLKELLPTDKTDNTLSSKSPPNIPFEGDWCIKTVDLSKDDFEFAKKESKDWALKRGQIFFNHVDFAGEYTDMKNSELLEPYREIDLEELGNAISNNDRLAMVAALQRDDVEFELKGVVADRLLMLGDTGVGLFHKISSQLINARLNYKEHGEVTPEARQYLQNALTYVSYGISRYDAMPLNSYLSVVTKGLHVSALNPFEILTMDDFESIKKNVEELTSNIDEQRIKENFLPIKQIDIPKIAEHEFQSGVAVIYMKHGELLDKLQPLNRNGSPTISRTQCVERYFDLYGME